MGKEALAAGLWAGLQSFLGRASHPPYLGRAPSLRLPPLHFSFWKFLWGLLMEAYVTEI